MDDFNHNSNGFYKERVIEETIRHGPAYYRSNVGPSETTHDLPEPLTPRETEVLSLVARGLTNNQVAHRLTISPNTVHAHLHTIYSKLGVSGRIAAVRFAFEQGL